MKKNKWRKTELKQHQQQQKDNNKIQANNTRHRVKKQLKQEMRTYKRVNKKEVEQEEIEKKYATFKIAIL